MPVNTALAANHGGVVARLGYTQLSLLGIVSADIVMTGGGPGRNPPPFVFKLEDIHKA